MTSGFDPRAGQPDPGPFADLVLRHRLGAGLSQRELAVRSGLSERAVRDLERGATVRPRQRSVHAVATALGLRGDELSRFFATATAGTDAGRAAFLAARHAIPVSTVDDFVGRARELRQLADVVTGGRHRMVTLTGAGGVGKSRLAAELVAALRRHTARDVRTLDLTGLADPELVAEAIAETLDAGGGSRLPPVERAAATLRANPVLLVLDRFEHLLPAAPVVAAMLRRCPGLSVLVTSQRRLGIGGERLFFLDPLPIAAAVELFERRAAAVTPDFTLTSANTAAVTAICRAVDGLPLAVELAAARTRLMTPVELASRFDRQLRLLTGGAADLPERHRSLRATIESSLEIVTEDGRTLFAWLGAFACGVQLTDLEAVAASLGRRDDWLPAAVGELVDTSLVRVANAGGGGTTRYLMPDAMAELAREHLAARPDRDRVEHAAATHFLQRVPDLASQPHTGARREAGNIRSAVQYATAHDITLLDGVTLRGLLAYYEATGRPDEGGRLLTAAGDAGVPIAYLYAGKLARLRGDLPEAARLGRHAMSQLAENNPEARLHLSPAAAIEARLHLGAVATEAGESTVARSHFRAVLRSARRSQDLELMARALNSLGAVSAETGRLDHADRLFTASLEASRRRCGAAGRDVTASMHNLAEIALEMGRHEQALARAEEADRQLPQRLTAQLATVRALALLGLGRKGAAREAARVAEQWLAEQNEEHRHAALVRMRYSVILAATGEYAAAAEHLRGALPAMLDSTKRYHDEAATWLEAHARLLAGRGTDHDAVAAAQLLGAAGNLRRSSTRPISAANASTVDSARLACRNALGDSRFERELQAGHRLGVAALAGRGDAMDVIMTW